MVLKDHKLFGFSITFAIVV